MFVAVQTSQVTQQVSEYADALLVAVLRHVQQSGCPQLCRGAGEGGLKADGDSQLSGRVSGNNACVEDSSSVPFLQLVPVFTSYYMNCTSGVKLGPVAARIVISWPDSSHHTGHRHR
jgi:hypothetical protein